MRITQNLVFKRGDKMAFFGKSKIEKILSIQEAKQKVFDELINYTGWKFLKSQECLKLVVKDIVFEIQFYGSKYNCSYESIEINCEFLFWSKKLDKICNVNSKMGYIMFKPEENYWYDISTEQKINNVVNELKMKIDRYVLALIGEFEEDYNQALRNLYNNADMQEIYHLKSFKSFEAMRE